MEKLNKLDGIPNTLFWRAWVCSLIGYIALIATLVIFVDASTAGLGLCIMLWLAVLDDGGWANV